MNVQETVHLLRSHPSYVQDWFDHVVESHYAQQSVAGFAGDVVEGVFDMALASDAEVIDILTNLRYAEHDGDFSVVLVVMSSVAY